MLKSFSNIGVANSISFNTKYVKAGSGLVESGSSGLFENVNENDFVLLDVRSHSVGYTERITDWHLLLPLTNVPPSTELKLVKYIPGTEPVTTAEQVQSLISTSTVFERIMLNEGGSGNISEAVTLDLRRFQKSYAVINPNIELAIFFAFQSGSGSLNVGDLEKYNAEGIELSVINAAEICGIDSSYKFDEHGFGECGDLLVNLVDGQAIYKMNVLSGVKTQLPMGFTLYHNPYSIHQGDPMCFGFVPNFRYRFTLIGSYFTLESADGGKRAYKELEYTESEKQELTHKYGINHLSTSGIIYRCIADGSYLFYNEAESKVTLYDREDTEMTFELSGTLAKIKKVKNRLGKEINYTWNGNKLSKAVNPDNEEMTLTYGSYNNKDFLQRVDFAASHRYATFEPSKNTESSKMTVKVFDNSDGSSEAIVHTEFTLEKDQVYIMTVKNCITGQYLNTVNVSDKKVKSVTLLSADGTEIGYRTEYYYGDGYTKAVDIEGNYLIYSFDRYGRAVTVIDKYGRSVSTDYAKSGEEATYRPSGRSKVQCLSRNLIENHGFENTGASPEAIPSWTKTGFVNSEAVIEEGGVLGERCLKITTSSGESVTLSQTIKPISSNKFTMRGFIKHPSPTGITSTNVKVGLECVYTVTSGGGEVPFQPAAIGGGTKLPVIMEKKIKKYATLELTNTDWYEFLISPVTIPIGGVFQSLTAVISVDGVNTTVYVDDLQMTASRFNTRYNLVENGYMEFYNTSSKPSSWTFDCLSGDGGNATSTTDIHRSLLGNNVMRFTSVPTAKFINGTSPYKLRTMHQTISSGGMAGDRFVLTAFTKGFVSDNDILRAYIKLDTEPNKKYVELGRHNHEWQVLTAGLGADRDYNSITVGIEYDGDGELLIDCVGLYRDSYGTYYNYDKRGNITETISSEGIPSRASYNSDNSLTEVCMSDGSFYRYEYNSTPTGHSGLVSKITDLYGNTVSFTYDAKDRVTRTVTKHGSEEFVNTVVYNDEQNTRTVTDEHGNSTVYTMDYLDRTTSVLDPISLLTSYTYDKKSRVRNMLALVEQQNSLTESHGSITGYDSVTGDMLTLDSYGDLDYDFTYDSFGRVETVKSHSLSLESFTYDTAVNGYRRGNLVSKSVGVSEGTYSFTYDEDNRVTSISLNGETLAEYSYDENGDVYELSDAYMGISKYFSYDLKGNLVKVRTLGGKSISYTYDNLGSIQRVSYTDGEKSRSVDYEYDYECNEYTKEGLFSRLDSIFGDEIVLGGNNGKGLHGAEPNSITGNAVYDDSVRMYVDEFSSTSDYRLYDAVTFNSSRTSGSLNISDEWHEKAKNVKSFYAFIKPMGNSFAEQEILALGKKDLLDRNGNKILIDQSLRILSDGRLCCGDYSYADELTTSGKLKLNEWNFIGLKFEKISGNNSFATATLFINDEKVTNINKVPEERSAFIEYTGFEGVNRAFIMNSCYESDWYGVGETEDLTMPIRFCMMSFGVFDYSDKDFAAIYNEAKKYIFDVDSELRTERSQSTLYCNDELYSGFEVATLNGSFDTASGTKPFDIVHPNPAYRYGIPRSFSYDEELKRYVFGYCSEAPILDTGFRPCVCYKYNLSVKGTVSLRIKPDSYIDEKNVFSIGRNGEEYLRLYMFNNTFYISGTKLTTTANTQISASANEWHSLILTYDLTRVYVYLDGVGRQVATMTSSIIANELYIGSPTNTALHFCGLMEMLAYKSGTVNTSTINAISAQGVPVTSRNVYDSIGRLRYDEIKTHSGEIVTTYEYDKSRVARQTFANGEIYEYEYDGIGNVTDKRIYNNSQSASVTEEMLYDKLGRLVSMRRDSGSEIITEDIVYDTDGNIDIRTFDDHGNIFKRLVYTYDSTFKDKLLSITDTVTNTVVQNITYGESSFYPTSMTVNGASQTLSWNGKRLTSIGGNVSYSYDASGIRTSKTVDGLSTIYELEGDRVISMTKQLDANNSVQLDFVYDSNSKLIGLNANGNNYFYLRDVTGNILGVINSDGDYVVKYSYDAWGVPTTSIQTGYTSDLAALYNPFIYKGYLYDDETGWYYLKTRYYAPELCRFLQVSDISNLNPQSINGLNLYAYANNNTVSFSYNNSSAIGSNSVVGGLVSSIGTGSPFSGNVSSGSISKGGLNLGWIANGLDTGSTIHGLYTSISGLVNHTAYFAKNLAPFADDMTTLGASMKDGVLAFNQFSWGLGKSDVFGIALGVGLDIYDSIQRGVSPGGVVLGATLTAAKGVGLIYLNKGIMYGATAIGSCFGPVGTVVGFVVGGIVCIVVDIFASNWLDDLIDKIAK